MKTCFGRNTKFVRECEDFAGNRESLEIFRETRKNKVKMSGILRYFFYQKFGTIFPIFGSTFTFLLFIYLFILFLLFYLHMVRLKQRLLELSMYGCVCLGGGGG